MILFSYSLLPYKVLLVCTALLQGIGSLIYALSVEPWMVIVGRFFLGSSATLPLLAFMWYCIASMDVYKDLCLKLHKPINLRLKRLLTVMLSFSVTGAYVASICESIMRSRGGIMF